MTLDPAVSVVIEDKCRACGTCVDICEFQAPELVELSGNRFTARINSSLCKGCGTCTSWCPSAAIQSQHFTNRQLHAQIDAVFEKAVTE